MPGLELGVLDLENPDPPDFRNMPSFMTYLPLFSSFSFTVVNADLLMFTFIGVVDPEMCFPLLSLSTCKSFILLFDI